MAANWGGTKTKRRVEESMSRRSAQPSRRSAVEPFLAMDVMRAAIDLEAAGRSRHPHGGRPARRAGAEAGARRRAAPLADGRLGYTEALGLRRLRAAHRRATTARPTASTCSPERIAVTTGSSAGFNLAFLAAFDPGDRIALAAPGYPAYRNILGALGLEVVDIETSAETRHVITPEMLAAAHREGAARRRAGGEPGQSDRHDDAARRRSAR